MLRLEFQESTLEIPKELSKRILTVPVDIWWTGNCEGSKKLHNNPKRI
jgi:hypothetical protein